MLREWLESVLNFLKPSKKKLAKKIEDASQQVWRAQDTATVVGGQNNNIININFIPNFPDMKKSNAKAVLDNADRNLEGNLSSLINALKEHEAMRVAQCIEETCYVSEEAVQELAAVILEEQVENPQRNLSATLKILNGMSREDLEAFRELSTFAIGGSWIYFNEPRAHHESGGNTNMASTHMFDPIRFDNLSRFVALRLMDPIGRSVHVFDHKADTFGKYSFGRGFLYVKSHWKDIPPDDKYGSNRFSGGWARVPVVKFTSEGKALLRAVNQCGFQTDHEHRLARSSWQHSYLKSLAACVQGKCSLFYSGQDIPVNKIEESNLLPPVSPWPEPRSAYRFHLNAT